MVFATHWTRIIWVEIKTLQVLQQAKKAPDAWSQRETTQKKRQPRPTFYSCYDDWFFDSCPVEVSRWYQSCFVRSQKNFHTLSTAIFTRDQFASIKSCKSCQWSHDLCDRSGIFEHPNDSLQWMILSFSYNMCFLSNSVKPTRVL